MDMVNLSPLEGIRVVEFTTAWVGPGCGMMLAEMGAEVIRIDNPELPDLHRRMPPYADGIEGLNRAGLHALYNRGKKECILDLKKAEAVETAKDMIRKTDIVITNFAPRVMDSLGLGYSVLQSVKPDLIMVSASGYGATGPDKDCLAYGAVLEAYAGLDSLIGYPGGPPQGCGLPISDHTAATLGAFAALSALHHRDLTGEGQFIDFSEVEGLLACIPDAVMEFTMNGNTPQPQGNKDDYMAPHGCYKCRGDDQWVAIAVQTADEWRSFCRAIGSSELCEDDRFRDRAERVKNEDSLNEIITEWTGKYNHMEVMEKLQEVGVAAVPVYTAEEFYRDPHIRDRGFFVACEHPETGTRELPGVFAKLSETPGKVQGREALQGEHSDWVLTTLLASEDK